MPPLITIGLPVYNGMPYLPETMDSLLDQDESRFEILAIDDGSTDDSLAYLRSIQDSRVRVITQTNRGLTATLNRMLAEVSTPWLMRHDADDIAYPNRVRRTMEYITRYPEAGMFYSLAEYNSAGKRCGTFPTTQGTPQELRKIVQSGYLLSMCHVTVTLNVRKTLDVGSYRFDLHVEDIDLWWRMALNYDLRFIPEVTVGYRHNLDGVSSKNLRNQVLNTLYVQYLLISHLWRREPLAYESAIGLLAGMVNWPALRFRQEIRAASSDVSERAYLSAICHAGRAFLASPKAFMARALYELHRDKTFRVGQKPEIFASESLWAAPAEPTASGTRGLGLRGAVRS